ncbi:E3 ubiquitin-protein ligase [Schistosoma japonicum]|uniref:E3 ubiquitin-protein ligase n=1 Tax=Schistosoma japonicum TaxID=6182 RepID=A0A4Z2DI70_SCHJA|nr:E3 ubiquitin-protein ligase [Schistosoma japonicum]
MCPSLSGVSREHSELKRLRSHVSLITCFTLSICSAAYMYKLVDEIIIDCETDFVDGCFTEDYNKEKNQPTNSQLKAVLDQRGVLYSSVRERTDIERAINSTGFVTANELASAKAEQLKFASKNFSNSPDALLYRKLVDCFHKTVKWNYASSSLKPNSIVFDSESEFIEHVEDKKDSVWLLAVASPHSLPSPTTGDHKSTSSLRIKPASVVTEEIWSVLSYRYQSFGFKTGLLNCEKLQSLCIDRGFINPDLILALPKGGERMKDIVQFRPLPKNPTSKLIIDHESSNYILKGIHAWIISVLAERVKPLKDINSIYSIYSVLSTDRLIKMDYLKQLWSTWLFKRPQPIHVLWFPEFSVKSKFSYSHQHAPLVLSALSVTYTGRVRFWIVLNETLNQNYTISDNNWPITTSSINTVSDLLISINCSIKSHFIIFTPEGKCYSFGSNEREYLSYENLGFLLHYLYPSADDFLWILVLVTTVLVLINGAIEAGRILLLVIHSFSMDYNLVENHRSGSTGTRRSALARTVIKLARQGWTSHIPNFNASQHSIYNDRSFDNHYRLTNENQPIHENQMNASSSSQYLPSTNMRSFISSHILEWIKIFFLDLFSAYFLLLLAILPLLNLLSLPYSLPIVNLTLWLLRSFILSSPMINLRLSILSGHLNWYHSCSFILTFWLFIVFLSSCVLLKYEKLNGRLTSNNSHSRRLSRLNPILVRERLNQIPPDQLWDELSRLIIQSDIELRSGSTDSATSSTLESESRYHHSCNNQSKSTNESLLSNIELPQSNYGENAEVVEGNRLLRRLRRLYNILSQQTDHLTSTSMNPIASFSSDLYHQGNGENDELLNHKTAAHMYTWNCLRSLGNNNNNSNTVRSSVGVNSSQYRSHTRKSFSVSKQPTNYVMDTSYEAEDECEDPTGDDDKRGVPKISSFIRRRHRVHLHSHLHSSRLSHPITSSSNSSSTSDPNNSDHEPYLGNSSVPSREVSKRTNLISTSSVLSTSSSSSYISSNDVSFTNSSNDWPSWVVPCKECVVCWQRFRPGVRLSALPCGHGFHEHCIRKWLDTGAFECPVCRWPAYAPHLRQQCQMIGQLINAVQNTIEFAKNSPNRTNNS